MVLAIICPQICKIHLVTCIWVQTYAEAYVQPTQLQYNKTKSPVPSMVYFPIYITGSMFFSPFYASLIFPSLCLLIELKMFLSFLNISGCSFFLIGVFLPVTHKYNADCPVTSLHITFIFLFEMKPRMKTLQKINYLWHVNVVSWCFDFVDCLCKTSFLVIQFIWILLNLKFSAFFKLRLLMQ